MSQAFFDRWFPDEPHNQQGFFGELAQVLPRTGSILDLGCGANHHLAAFRSDEREVWGTDLQRHPQLAHPEWYRPMPPDATIPFDDASFDVVSTFMVVEHVGDPEAFLREVARVLRPGGYFVAHTISSLHYVTWVRRVLDVCPHAFTQWLVRKLYGREEHDTFPTCYRMNTPRRIARLAEPIGFEPAHVQRYACPGYFMFSRILYRAAVMADWGLDRMLPGLGRIYFTATLRKAEALPGVLTHADVAAKAA
jgi:SAM-dependent methyltransferase